MALELVRSALKGGLGCRARCLFLSMGIVILGSVSFFFFSFYNFLLPFLFCSCPKLCVATKECGWVGVILQDHPPTNDIERARHRYVTWKCIQWIQNICDMKLSMIMVCNDESGTEMWKAAASARNTSKAQRVWGWPERVGEQREMPQKPGCGGIVFWPAEMLLLLLILSVVMVDQESLKRNIIHCWQALSVRQISIRSIGSQRGRLKDSPLIKRSGVRIILLWSWWVNPFLSRPRFLLFPYIRDIRGEEGYIIKVPCSNGRYVIWVKWGRGRRIRGKQTDYCLSIKLLCFRGAFPLYFHSAFSVSSCRHMHQITHSHLHSTSVIHKRCRRGVK